MAQMGPEKLQDCKRELKRGLRDGAEQAAQKGGEETFVVSWEQKLRDSRQELKDTVVAEMGLRKLQDCEQLRGVEETRNVDR